MAVAGTVLLAGSVQAAERPDDRGGMIGVGGTQVVVAPPDAFERAVLRQASTMPVPDVFERAVIRAQSATVRPDDRAGTRGPGAVATEPPSAVATADEGFSRDDALLGAALMLGTGLVVVGATALTLRHRSAIAR